EGEELIVQVEKMSKSKLNGVSPDEIIEEFGADSLRLYEMFMGPFEREKVWSTDAVNGCKRFLNRFYDMVFSDEKVVEEESIEALRLTHRLLDQVTKDIDGLQFNTAIAHMMEFINAFIPLPTYPKSCLVPAIQMLYPFAPHIAEEMWEHLGQKELLTYTPIPPADPKYLVQETATYVVQINGKVRGKWELPINQSEKDLIDLAHQKPEVAKHITAEIAKVIFIPNKLLNIVTK
ncbi:MAG: class I tRNA ligase family protein, partial [Chlamydiae bacterium]|nr:class I tRNA ligase family protein [Chlamydiota bacterium]